MPSVEEAKSVLEIQVDGGSSSIQDGEMANTARCDIRSSTLSAISIDHLFEQQRSKDEHPPIKRGRCLQDVINGAIRWIKACLSDRRLANEVLRTTVAVVIFICMVLLMTLAQMFSDRWFALYTKNLVYVSSVGGGAGNTSDASAFPARAATGIFSFTTTNPYGMAAVANETVYATDPLFDHVSALLPDKSSLRSWLPDAFLTSFLIISLVVTLLFPRKTRIKYQSIVVGRRMLWILTILYLFRMCSFLATTVPNPVHNCIPKYPQNPSSYLILMGRMATGKISACTDNIYSGHTTLATVLFYSNIVYARRWYFSIYSVLHVAVIIITILLTRLHYSVDVLIALFMTSFVYCLYHFLLLIHVDQGLLDRSSLSVNRDKLEAACEDPRYLAERRLILRLTGDNMMRFLAWMDGLDLRTGIERQSATDNHNVL